MTPVIQPEQMSEDVLRHLLVAVGFQVRRFSGNVTAGMGTTRFSGGGLLATAEGNDLVVTIMADGNYIKVGSFFDYKAPLDIAERFELLLYFMEDVIVARAYEFGSGAIILDSFVPVSGGITTQAIANAVCTHEELSQAFLQKHSDKVERVSLG